MPNRLARETSPYLRQHADNPVDWRPWSDDALEEARATDRPILLSIGYSACHWCHVMERESFADPGVAELMNRGFVNVKVDREERPDVDTIYMRAVQALTGGGGWPLTVFLTPDGRPFYGGTYFPPEPRHGLPSFRQVLEATLRAWEERRSDVDGAASEITGILDRANRISPLAGDEADVPGLDRSLTEAAARALLARLDPAHGGFGSAPKFPQPSVIDFLLAHHARTAPDAGGSPALDAALLTLRAMARGGIRDHLGGGFHRYAVDARWLVPHFEKMLYDNALLAGSYLRAFQLTGEPVLEEVARETLDYLLADLRSPEGGFYAARDADSEGEEGRFYLWTRDEVDALLGEAESELFRRCYDVSSSGNFEGRNILHLPHDLEVIARGVETTPDALRERLARDRKVLFEARARRVHPARDSKILAGWNGLALRSLAEAGAALDEPHYLDAAREGTTWLLEALRPGGRLLHQVPGEGGRRIFAFLEDLASLGNACLSLHEATLEPRWLDESEAMAREIEERFREPESKLLYDTPTDGESLVVRPREVMDNAVPAGGSLAAELFLRLGRLLGRQEWTRAAEALVERERPGLVRMPSGFGHLLQVAEAIVRPPVEVALVGAAPSGEGGADPGLGGADPGLDTLLRETHRPFLPGRVVTGRHAAGPAPDTPLLEGRGPVDGKAAAYVCRNHACRAPVTSPRELAEALHEARRPPPGAS
jgi:uncharacterized protein